MAKDFQTKFSKLIRKNGEYDDEALDSVFTILKELIKNDEQIIIKQDEMSIMIDWEGEGFGYSPYWLEGDECLLSSERLEQLEEKEWVHDHNTFQESIDKLKEENNSLKMEMDELIKDMTSEQLEKRAKRLLGVR